MKLTGYLLTLIISLIITIGQPLHRSNDRFVVYDVGAYSLFLLFKFEFYERRKLPSRLLAGEEIERQRISGRINVQAHNAEVNKKYVQHA